WEFKPASNAIYNSNSTSPVVSADQTIYFYNADQNLYAFDPFGTKKWSLELHFTGATPLIASDGTLFVTAANQLVAVSPEGKATPKPNLSVSPSSSPPPLAPRAPVYIVATRGQLPAFAGGHGGLMDSAWPKLQADPGNPGNARAF